MPTDGLTLIVDQESTTDHFMHACIHKASILMLVTFMKCTDYIYVRDNFHHTAPEL